MPIDLTHKENILTDLSVAIVHEWFVNYAGSERVVENFLKVTPEAQLYALVDHLKENERGYLGGRKANTTFIQNLPFSNGKFRSYLPLFPLAIESLDLRQHDLILSSNHAVAKGIIKSADQFHISYCHSPMRYAWDLYHQYLSEAKLTRGIKGFLAQTILSNLRIWDYVSAQRVNQFVANSHYIKRRILNVYGRTADVIYPPVETEKFTFSDQKDDYYFTAARFVPYKKVDLVVEAFSQMPTKKLIVVGNGPETKKIKQLATPNITLLDHVSSSELQQLMTRAKAFVFAAEEDFGITLAEAQAAGTPVVAFGKGGAAEIVLNEKTGILFPQQTASSLIDAIQKFENKLDSIEPSACADNAQRFSVARFQAEWNSYISEKWEGFKA
jgi:glycosyltransferase involved in cell wall biosynthesis